MKKFSTLFLLAALPMLLFAYNPGDIIILDLTSPTTPASFSYGTNGAWVETYNDATAPIIEAQVFQFAHLSTGIGTSYGGMAWNGFTASINGDSTKQTDFMTNQWGVMAGGGVYFDTEGNLQASNNYPYLLAYWSSYDESADFHTLQVDFADNASYSAMGCYIANSPYVYYTLRDGIGFARAFNQEGDYLKIIAHGVDSLGVETTTEFFLAQFANGTLQMSRDWEWFDLSSLGTVERIYFTMESTDSGDYGINTPSYFCLSHLQVQVPTTTAADAYLATSISVYPNPMADYLNVVSNHSDRLNIYNLQGQVVLSTSVTEGANTISVSHLAAGAYIVKCGTQSVKVVK